MSEEINEEQAQELLREFSESKQTIHNFLTNVIREEDTTKTGNLNEEELGKTNLPLRSAKELELFCEQVWNQKSWKEYFKKLGNINTDTSLSKEGFLMRLGVTQKKELQDTTLKPKKENKGWFKSKK